MNYAAATPSCQIRVHLFNASQPPTTTILRKKSGLCAECEDEKSQREPCNSLRTIPHPLWKPNSPCSFALKEQWAATVYRFLSSIILSNPPPPRGRRPTSNATSSTSTGQNAKSMSNTTATARNRLGRTAQERLTTHGRNSNNGNSRATLQCSFFRPHSKDYRNIDRSKIAKNKPTLDQPKPDASLRPIEKRNKTERKGNST